MRNICVYAFTTCVVTRKEFVGNLRLALHFVNKKFQMSFDGLRRISKDRKKATDSNISMAEK